MRACAALAGLACVLTFAVAARAGCEMTDVLDVPVKLEGLAPVVEVKLDGHAERLVVDSGSYSNSLSPSAAKALRLETSLAPYATAEGTNGDFLEDLATVKIFEMAGMKVKNVPFTVGGAELGGGVAGLLGQDLLGSADIDFDLAGGFIRFMRPTGCGGQPLAYWAKPGQAYGVVDVRSSDPDAKDLVGEAEVNGVKVKVLFDTGGGDSTLSLAAARRAGLSPSDPGAVPAGDLGGFGPKKVASWIVPVKSFEIGGERILNTRLRISDWVGAGRLYADMILGGDFFASHHVLVANSQHKVYFTYNGGPVFDVGRVAK